MGEYRVFFCRSLHRDQNLLVLFLSRSLAKRKVGEMFTKHGWAFSLKRAFPSRGFLLQGVSCLERFLAREASGDGDSKGEAKEECFSDSKGEAREEFMQQHKKRNHTRQASGRLSKSLRTTQETKSQHTTSIGEAKEEFTNNTYTTR